MHDLNNQRKILIIKLFIMNKIYIIFFIIIFNLNN